MSARNMVRSLRDSGALQSRSPSPAWRSTVLFVAAALMLGAGVYLGAAYGVPAMMQATEKKPAPVNYAKPDAPVAVATASDRKPYSRADEVACNRYGAAARKRADQAKAKQGFSFDLAGTRYAELAGNLVCEAQTRPMRLCDPAERARFIDRSKDYFAEVQMMVGMFGSSMNSPAFALVPPNHPGPDMINDMANQSVRTIATEHRKVVKAFRDLVVRGLVSAGDFNPGIFGPPDAVKSIFVDLPPVEDVCVKA